MSILPPIYEPEVEIPEQVALDLVGKKVGERIQAIVSYTVIERTKNYAVLRISSVNLVPTRRSY